MCNVKPAAHVSDHPDMVVKMEENVYFIISCARGTTSHESILVCQPVHQQAPFTFRLVLLQATDPLSFTK